MTWYGGLDLGQASDWTALVLLEQDEARVYRARHLDRTRGLPYVGTPASPGLVDKLSSFWRETPALRGCQLAADRTGVGRAVIDALRAAGLPCAVWAVTVTGGQEARQELADLWVPKKDLVGVALTLFGQGRLEIDSRLPHAADLRRELKAFTVRVSASGHESYEAWREGEHDDLVFAVALACWLGERFPPFTRGSIGTSNRHPPRPGRQRPRSPFAGGPRFGGDMGRRY